MGWYLAYKACVSRLLTIVTVGGRAVVDRPVRLGDCYMDANGCRGSEAERHLTLEDGKPHITDVDMCYDGATCGKKINTAVGL